MDTHTHLRSVLVSLLTLCAGAMGPNAFAQPKEASDSKPPFEYPAAPERWLNSAPLSSDTLKGKAVFFWFFEEGCPRCAAKWPELIALSQEYQDKPIVFVGVNSGTPRRAVQAYLQQHRVAWPVIADEDRSFERLCEVGEISLQNIHAVRYVAADGSLQVGRWNDLAGTAKEALKDAAWRVDPADIPEELKPAWFHVEIGDFVRARPLLRRAANAKNETIQTAAKKLMDAVELDLNQRIADADQSLADRDSWQAYRQYDDIARRFRGYELPPKVTDELKSLAADKAVARQLQAGKQLDAAKKTGSRGTPAAVKRAIGMLEKMVETDPTTDAAQEAQEILAKVAAGT